MSTNNVLAVKEKVQRYLVDVLGTIEVDSDGDFTFRHGSARLFVSVVPMGETATFVMLMAITNRDVPASLELYKYVATEAHSMFGHLECDEKNGKVTVRLLHNFLGEFLDPDELQFAVGILAETADEIDDQIVARFGGRRFHED